MHAHHDDADAGQLLRDTHGGVWTAEAGHADIEQNDFGFVERGEVDCFVAIGGFGNHLELALAFQKDAEAASNEGMIVRNHDARVGGHSDDSSIAFGTGIARSANVASNRDVATRWRGGIGNFLQRLAWLPHLFRDGTPTEDGEDPGVLAVTADLGLYSCILNAACTSGWTAEWAASVSRALAVCSSKTIRIVVYDSNLPYSDWRNGLRQLARTPSSPRVLLASPHVDEDLWRTVRRLRGYDVMARSANSEQFRRELKFASLSLGQL
jgi:hypothetical protein